MLVEEYPDKISWSRHCKTLLSSPTTYNNNHLLLFFRDPTGFVHWTYSYGKHVHELNWDNNEDLCKSTKFDFPFNSCIFRVVATCNGLVCITTKYTITVSFSGTLALESL